MNNLKKLLAVVVSVVMIISIMLPAFADASGNAYSYSAEAQVLNDLGLYKGISQTTFDPDLGTALDRETGVVMLLRMFGLEDQALAMTDADSVLAKFSDAGSIAAWAKNDVAYAVENGLVVGYPDGTFGPQAALNGKAYCTLIMRQLGFTPDYSNAPAELAEKGGLDAAQAVEFTTKDLIKDDLVGISYGALKATDKDGSTVIENLVSAGVITEQAASDAGLIGPSASPTPTPGPAAALDVASVAAINNTSAEMALNTAATAADVSAATVTVAERDSGKALAVKSVDLAAWDSASKTVDITTDPQVANTIYKVTVGDKTFNFVGKGTDTTAPKLTAASATANTTVELTFDKLLDATTALDPASYKIVKKSGSGSDLTVSRVDFGSSRKIVDLTVSSMTSGTVYTAEPTGVKDASMNAVDSSNNTKDFGGRGKDTTAPAIVTATATANNTVEVVFDRKLDLATAQDIANYTMTKKTGSGTDIKVLAASLDTADSTTATYYKKVTLTTESQASGTVYTLKVINLQNYDGKAVDSAGITRDFGGKAKDTTAPGFNSVTATANNTVEVKFDRKVDTTTAQNIANYTITKKTGSGSDIAVTAAVLDTDSTSATYLTKVTLTTESQTQGTVYTLKVVNVQNRDGAVIASGGITKDFGGKAKDTTAPTITTMTPAYDATTGEYSVMVTFSDRMDKATAEDILNYSIDTLGYPVSATLQDDTTQVKLVTGTMSLGKSYTVTFNNVNNSDGTAIAANATASFTGVAPVTAGKPGISSVVCNNAKELTITFDKNIDSTGDNAANYKLYRNGSQLSWSFMVKRDGVNSNVVYLTLDSNSSFSDNDIITLETTGIKDANGLNPQTAGFGSSDVASYTFGGNASAISAIDISAVVPVDSKTINVIFTKQVDPTTANNQLYYGIGASLSGATTTPQYAVLATTGDNAYKEVTLRFASAMTEGNIYYINIKSVKDYVGQYSMAGTALGSFASDAVGQTTFSAAGGAPSGLTILAITPVNKRTIDVQFSAPMSFNTTDGDGTGKANDDQLYSIKTSDGTAFTTVAHAMKIDDSTVRLFTDKDMQDGTIYALVTNNGLTDKFGTGYTTPGGVSGDDNFVTFSALGDDNAAPSISAVSVLNKNTLQVKFSEPVEGLADSLISGDNAKTTGANVYTIYDADGSSTPAGFTGNQHPTGAVEIANDTVNLTFGADFMAGKTYRLVMADNTVKDAAGLAYITTTNDANFFKFDGIVGGAVVSQQTACATPGVTKSVTGAVLSDIIKLQVVGEPLTGASVAVKTTLTNTQAGEIKNLGLYEVASDGTGAALVSGTLTDATLTAGYLTFSLTSDVAIGTHYYVIKGDTASSLTDGSVKFEVEAGKVAFTGATTGIATVSVGADAGTAVTLDDTAPTAIAISAQDTIASAGSVTLTATNGPLSDDSWNAILTQIKANTATGSNWITGITADKLTITPAADGVTATLNNTDGSNAATMAADFVITSTNVIDRAGNVAASDITIDSAS